MSLDKCLREGQRDFKEILEINDRMYNSPVDKKKRHEQLLKWVRNLQRSAYLDGKIDLLEEMIKKNGR